MILQILRFCGCKNALNPMTYQAENSQSHNDSLQTQNKIVNKQFETRAMIRIGEITKLRKEDKIPHLEITVEMENDKINPDIHFIYLHQVQDKKKDQEIDDKKIYRVEKMELAENIGRGYIKIDFDRSRRYKVFLLRSPQFEGKKKQQNKENEPNSSNRIMTNFQLSSSYEILAQTPSFSIQPANNKKPTQEQTSENTRQVETCVMSSNDTNINTLGIQQVTQIQVEPQPYEYKNVNSEQFISPYKNQESSSAKKNQQLNESGDSILMSPLISVNQGSLSNIANNISTSQIQQQLLQPAVNSSILRNYNPQTRTYFKCSIYSPSNRLYTVDEVNSTFSAEQFMNQSQSKQQSQRATFFSNNIRQSVGGQSNLQQQYQSWIGQQRNSHSGTFANNTSQINNLSHSPNNDTLSPHSSSRSDNLQIDKTYNIDDSQSSNSASRKKKRESLDRSIIFLQNTGGGSGGTTDSNPFTVNVSTLKQKTKGEAKYKQLSSVERDKLSKGRESAPMYQDSRGTIGSLETDQSSQMRPSNLKSSLKLTSNSRMSYRNSNASKLTTYNRTSFLNQEIMNGNMQPVRNSTVNNQGSQRRSQLKK
ncbi:UNKNOWN [Stylonychia lemnae]|uniref:Uncharacterized protein n=1 Tax=Stylonychia lemnae TaxID=5949 RepID=A0A078AUP0_STYLE|nr:UNKNOWN [Stylonychia lemnae]|eukprot:CDW84957.1 UNKNOWN [Stylonychia lemnae]